MGKILVSASHFDTLCQEAWSLLEEHGHTVIFDPNRKFPAYSAEELKEILPQIDAALIGLDAFTAEIFDIPSPLKVVAKFGVGIDNIDLQAAKLHGVKVLNTPGMNSNAVSELTIAFILSLLRSVTPLHNQMVQGIWSRYIGGELSGRTVGLVGFGAIARSTARKLRAFDAKVIAYDMYPNYKAAEELGVDFVSLDELVRRSDIISLHIPASPETKNLFNEETFAKMKPGSFLINTARGSLVDIQALYNALQSGHLAGAALDAFDPEPLPDDSPIRKCKNVLLTPHTGAETVESYRRVSLTACRGICDVLDGKEPQYWQNR